MKTVAYALYVVTVLLISGLARANAATLSSFEAVQPSYQTPVQVSQVSLDSSKVALMIAGSLPNPCYGTPSAMMTQDSDTPNVLVLRLSSPAPMDACISRVKYFSADVELLRLVAAAHIKLDGNTTYTLKVEGSEFALPIQGSELMRTL
ncbi:MAG: hypothetical protein ACXVA9_04025 [Bdellovibrionales bacterium]